MDNLDSQRKITHSFLETIRYKLRRRRTSSLLAVLGGLIYLPALAEELNSIGCTIEICAVRNVYFPLLFPQVVVVSIPPCMYPFTEFG